jgi:hypothetical protein
MEDEIYREQMREGIGQGCHTAHRLLSLFRLQRVSVKIGTAKRDNICRVEVKISGSRYRVFRVVDLSTTRSFSQIISRTTDFPRIRLLPRRHYPA